MTASGNNKSNKNQIVLKGFALSFLFVAVFVLGYILSAELVAQLFPYETGSLMAVWGPSIMISLVCSLVCCSLMFLFHEKTVVPSAFVFIAVYYLVLLLVAALKDDSELRGVGMQLISIYALPPTILGNLLSWGIYYLYLQRKGRKVK